MDFGMFEVEDMVQDEQATSTIIKVVGVGGAGGNAVIGQFDISDHRGVEEMKRMIYDQGYQPVFKDWHQF